MTNQPRYVVANVEDLAYIDGEVMRRSWEIMEGSLDGAVLNQDWHVVDRLTGQAVLHCASQVDAQEAANKMSAAFPDGWPTP